MRIDNFSLEVVGGREDGEGYVKMQHNQKYSVTLRNDRNQDADVELDIDGKSAGIFRVNRWSSVTIERPVNDQGQFTFLKDGTAEAREANLQSVSRQLRGIVRATFKPERPRRNVSSPLYLASMDSAHIGSSEIEYALNSNTKGLTATSFRGGPRGQSVSSGGTGLTGHSNQKFVTVKDLDYVDSSQFVTINLRLVCDDNGVRPFISAAGKTNPVPRPV